MNKQASKPSWKQTQAEKDRDELAMIVLRVRKELETINWNDLSTAEKNIWGYVTTDKHPDA